jgi:hypothetical protein
MTLFLHIGMQKTGTTALQISMAADRPALVQAGILYPSGSLGLGLADANAHHYLAHAMQERRYGHTPAADFRHVPQYCRMIAQAAAAFSGDTVLSSEDFSRLPRTGIARLRPLLPPETKIVIYLRRQDHWIDSLYGHALKFGTAPDLPAFIANQRRRLNYERFLADWSAVFGAENIIVRAYEREARQNLWADFCQALGRPAARTALVGLRRDNTRLAAWQIALLDDVPDPETRRRLRRLIEQHNCAQDTSDRLHHLPVEMARDLIARHQTSNRVVAQRFLHRDVLFTDQSTPRIAAMPPEDLNEIRSLLAELGPMAGMATDPAAAEDLQDRVQTLWDAIDAALLRLGDQHVTA